MIKKEENIINEEGSVITFYSYKGGVGRSMALVNLACLLVKRGKRILLIDWDLEAPGLHHFFNDNNKEQKGLIDLMTDLKSQIENSEIINEDNGYIGYLQANLKNFVSKDVYIEFADKNTIGSFDLIKSGCFDSEYARKLHDFDWMKFYKDSPSFFRIFAKYLSSLYDYILIDSRTGLADTSGICTMIMPERLVLVFSPNNQNIDGVLDVAKQARQYRLNSYDERTLAFYPLPSRIDGNNPEKRLVWLEKYSTIFQDFFKEIYFLESCSLKNYFEKATIRYSHNYAYGESIPVSTESITDKLSICYDYENFLNVLISDDPIWDILSDNEKNSNLREVQELFAKAYDLHRNYKYDEAINLYKKAIKLSPDNDGIWNNIGVLEGTKGNYFEAIYSLNKAIALNPNDKLHWLNLGNAYCDDKQYEKSLKVYNDILKNNPNEIDALVGIGRVYQQMKKFDDSIEFLNKAYKIIPNNPHCLNNLGITYSLNNEDILAVDYFKSALYIEPLNSAILNNLGISYIKLGRYPEAISSLQKSIEIDPRDIKGYINLGTAYEKDDKDLVAIDMFKKAININPKNNEAFSGLGFCYFKIGDLNKSHDPMLTSLKLGNNTNNAMNIGHYYLANKNLKEAKKYYNISLLNYKDNETFFKSMEDDFKHLLQYGIAKEDYDLIVQELKELSQANSL